MTILELLARLEHQKEQIKIDRDTAFNNNSNFYFNHDMKYKDMETTIRIIEREFNRWRKE